MHAEIVRVVQEMAQEGRNRLQASAVARRAGVEISAARRDMLDLVTIGDLTANFEVLSPETGETLRVFSLREEIPRTIEDDEGHEHAVTPSTIWVTFTPSDKLRASVTGKADTATKPVRRGKADRPKRAAGLRKTSFSTSSPTVASNFYRVPPEATS